MKIHCAYDELVEIEKLKPHPKNRNKHSKEQIERFGKILQYQGIRRPIRLSRLSGFITSGHGLTETLVHLKETKAPVNYQDYENEDQEYADIIADNSIASWAELELSAINLDVPDLGPNFDIDLLGLQNFTLDAFEKSDGEESSYTNKIEIPIYSPKGENPPTHELIDLSKTQSLLDEISAAECAPEIDRFLRFAAQRHAIFNYEKIAEFYAHADIKTQDLMEKSALVIIDLNKAIENGFVQLSKEIADIYDSK